MHIRRQDFGVLFLYSLGYSRIRNLVLRLLKKPVARFVTFHDIPPEALRGFEANLRFLKRSMNVVSLDDFFAGRLISDKINVVITFDDGYRSWITYAVPILLELKLPATFFVSSGFVGLSKEYEADFLQSKLNTKIGPGKIVGGLNFEDVGGIAKKGFTIGGHTLNHCDMVAVTDINQLRYEINEDKMRLEKMTGKKVDYFAYPGGGYYNTKINLIEALKESGYRGAVTTVPGFNIVGSNPFLLNRELTAAPMPEWVFRARVYGNYDAVKLIKQQLYKLVQ